VGLGGTWFRVISWKVNEEEEEEGQEGR
jgi:hypothetical protein